VDTSRGARSGVTKYDRAMHGTAGGCTGGRDAKPRGTLREGARIDSGGKPNETTSAGRGADMGAPLLLMYLSQKCINHYLNRVRKSRENLPHQIQHVKRQ
jgi:hypothetical protein